MAQPTGTVTLLFTDMQGSTRLLERLGTDRYAEVLELHRRLLREAFVRHEGYEVDCEGDAFFVAFASAQSAVAAAAEAQQALAAADWPSEGVVRVRIGIHSGEPLPAPSKYVGMDVHRAARIMAAGHGGQVLLSEVTRSLLEQDDMFGFRDLGEHTLKDLSEPQRLYQLLLDGLPAEFPALKTVSNKPTNLPVQTHQLIGRERELHEIVELLRSSETRLLTLIGTGGSGKTRLGLQAAAELIDDFDDGVYLVSLATISDPKLVISAIIETLGLREQSGRPLGETLCNYLREKKLLLVLDNLEHLVGAAPELSDVLNAAAAVRVLATSRAPLRLSRERLYPVLPLALPAKQAQTNADDVADSEAVRLLVERTQAVEPTFALTDENAETVAEICRRLDGLPLALELASARLRLLSPRALLNRLDSPLELLTRGQRDHDPRHTTLEETIAWSYSLLSEAERELFARLSIFRAGCRLEAVQLVCDPDDELGVDVLDGLDSLLDNSLIRRGNDSDDEPRYWMLETIREFAVTKLTATRAYERFATYFATLASKAADALGGSETDLMWLARMEDEQENLQAALEWALGHSRPEIASDLGIGLGTFWHRRGFLRKALYRLPPLLSEVTDKGRRIRLLRVVALITRESGDVAAARCRYEELQSIAGELGDRQALRDAIRGLAVLAFYDGDAVRACELLEEMLREVSAHGTASDQAYCMNNLGGVLLELGEIDRAEDLVTRSANLYRTAGNLPGLSLALHTAAYARLYAGDHDGAEERLREVIGLFQNMSDRQGIADSIEGLGTAAALRRDYRTAAYLWGAGEALREEVGAAIQPLEKHLQEQFAVTAVERLGYDQYAESRQVGCQTPWEDVVAELAEKERGGR